MSDPAIANTSASPDRSLAARLVQLIGQSLPDARDVSVESIAPMFGGNARKAWSLDLVFQLDGSPQRLACVMLSQGADRQIETDVAQEFRVLHGLNGKGTRAPAAVAMDARGEIVGAPTIVLERLPGKASAVDFLNSPDPAVARRLTEDLASVVADLHAVDWTPAAFDPVLEGLSPREVALRQIVHWHDTFLAQRLEPMPVMSGLFGWLYRHLPEPQRICLVHGDLRPGNFLYEGDRVSGLLDWEMAHLGDPVEDLAWIYRPLWSPERFVPLREFVQRYAELGGREIAWSDILYYRVFNELKFAVISLTAARAFITSGTPNMRHADRAATVPPGLKRCLAWVELHSKETSRV
ncbi:phosphotransferase family protein [Paraburkholderia xenovorans]|uniref:phosphotransferase family protein n=1 Tax=Paraburkholderia xenovorans TaxID=36873 RepID=UPI0015583A6B|nr:phosphotransferase family protein [Paraburkholderia xenovorans]NPT39204.1 phosphotransferase [Paraburkholderia xenovorans]